MAGSEMTHVCASLSVFFCAKNIADSNRLKILKIKAINAVVL